MRWFLGTTGLSPEVVSFGGRFGYEDAGNTANTQVVLHNYPHAPLLFETRGLPSSKEARKDFGTWARSMDNYRGSQVGVVVQCEHGTVLSTSNYSLAQAFGPDSELIESWTSQKNAEHLHFQNFLEAVRSRKRSDLHADVLQGHFSSALCHTGNISHQLGEPRTAKEILASDGVAKHARLQDSLGRMFKHLKANEVDIDKPIITAGVWLEMDPASERFTNNSTANELLRRQDRKPFVVPEVA